MSRVFRTTGQSRPWETRGYQDRSRVSGPIVRPEGEPSLLAGVGLLSFIVIVVAGLAVAFGG